MNVFVYERAIKVLDLLHFFFQTCALIHCQGYTIKRYSAYFIASPIKGFYCPLYKSLKCLIE